MSTNNGISNGSVLVGFSYGCISGSKRDQSITAEVLDQKHAEKDAGAWSSKLFPPSVCGSRNAFTKLRKHLGQMRAFTYENTFVWEDSLWRILPERRIQTFKTVVEIDGKEEAQKLLMEFVVDLPNLIDLARIGRGGAFKESDYPTVEQVREKYYYTVDYRPIPSASGLNPQLFQEAIDQLNLLHQQRLEEANTALLNRFMAPFKTLSDQLKNPERRKLAPVLETIKQLADDIPSLDLSGNEELRTLAGQVSQTFGELKPELLRQDEEMQLKLGQMADNTIATLQRFGSIGSRKFA